MTDGFTNIYIELPDERESVALVNVVPLSSKFDSNPLQNVLNDWTAIGNHGGFCHPSITPENTGIHIEFKSMLKGGNYEWQVHLTGCDNRCLVVLANLVADAGYKWLPESETIESLYDRVEITPPKSPKHGPSFCDYQASDFFYNEHYYPDFSDVMHSRVEIVGSSSVRAFRRFVIEFNWPIAEDKYEPTSELVELWKKICYSSYPQTLEDLYTGDGLIEDIAVDIFDESSLEIKIAFFGGSESAWNSLINLIGTMRSDIHVIKIY